MLNQLLIIKNQFISWSFFFLIQDFLLTFLVVPAIVFVAREYNLLYNPNKRSSHANPVPALGGVAIYLGFMITFQLLAVFLSHSFMIMLIATTLIFFIGLIDDLISVKAWQKLLFIIVISVFVVLNQELEIRNLNEFFQMAHFSNLESVLINIFIIVFVINAINLVDGVDGLASGLGILILGVFSYSFYESHQYGYLILSLPMAISLVAFLGYNIWGKRFKIFMGDSGSLLLGFIIAISLIRFLRIPGGEINEAIFVSPVSVFALLIVPVFDAIHVSVKRILMKRSPFHADKEHIHHTLLKLGLPHIITSFSLVAYSAAMFALSQVLMHWISEYIVLGVLVLTSFLLWNGLELRIKKNLRKYAHLRQVKRRRNFNDKVLVVNRKLRYWNSAS